MLWNIWVVHSFPLLNSSPISWSFSSDIQLCLTLYDPVDRSMLVSSFIHYLLEFAQIHVHYSLMLSKHLMLCCSLLILPSAFPSIRVFPNELAHHIRWLKYWSIIFSISPSDKYPGSISHHFMANRWGSSGNIAWLYFSGLQNHQMVIAAMKLKDAYSSEGKLWPT